ncbi:RagB/SusD family nutrient uptake outer membrane protein [Zunongwangia pacifica]|uniref:RagB/SusD family nutrient uptake outer membrane protein n=1 Tax=Zunongwangia pacifica TaxID=2911062 RepID=A0A9X2CKJ8_9FLAO|nr:RagB/SusD family nutrient uptake outer membrane protein [Zunongwangia pacifica]MCL6217500.1 RagB/SusD family nutrient uptake outer membrane protein [Zunongwangia pacifica]
MIKINKKILTCGALAILLGFTSCEDYLDVKPQDKLNEEQVYNDLYDADAAVVGIYGKLMGLAGKYIVLNELRADLISPTRNSSPDIEELNTHTVSKDNPYANPRDFYEVINNCNDALKNFRVMLENNKIDADEFNERYADIGTLRSWLYLQLGMHYGEVPYVTEPIEKLEDLQNENLYPRLRLEDLIKELINFTEGLPYTDPYNQNSSLVVDVDGYNTAKFFINKEVVLGDLQLWNGNYTEAASHYKNVMETSSNGTDSYYYDTYRIIYNSPNTVDLGVEYQRYREQDARALINSNTDGWGSIFARDQDDRWNQEWIWSLPFDSNFAPENPFINLFSIQSGDYVLKPSQRAIALWNNQNQLNGFPYDARGKIFSYLDVGGNPVVKKYLYNFLSEETQMPVDVFNRDGRWFLYRAAKLHLRFAEAANRDGHHKLADALLNYGIQNAYTVDGVEDVSDIEQTNLPFPYNFDARKGDFPFYRGPWYRNGGIRGRAYVERAEVVGDSLIAIENNIIEEAALELAFEGNRWGDLVRVAIHRNDPSFLADKVYEKLAAEGNPEANSVRARLMSRQNWFLPFKWENQED